MEAIPVPGVGGFFWARQVRLSTKARNRLPAPSCSRSLRATVSGRIRTYGREDREDGLQAYEDPGPPVDAHQDDFKGFYWHICQCIAER